MLAMKQTSSRWFTSVEFCIVFVFAVSALGQTNVTSPVSILFRSVPIRIVASYLPVLTERPLLMGLRVAGNFSYEGRGMSREQALRELQTELRAKDFFLIPVGDAYYKLVVSDQTNQVNTVPAITIEIRGSSITVAEKPVLLEAIADTLKQHLTDETEVWIYSDTSVALADISQRNRLVILQQLSQAKVRPFKIYELYLPHK